MLSDAACIANIIKKWKPSDMSVELARDIKTIYLFKNLRHPFKLEGLAIYENFKFYLINLRDDNNAAEINKKIFLCMTQWMIESVPFVDSLFLQLTEITDSTYWKNMEISAALINLYFTSSNAISVHNSILQACDHFKDRKQFVLNIFRPRLCPSDNTANNLVTLANWMAKELWNNRDVVAEFIKYDWRLLARAPTQFQNDETLIATCQVISLIDAPEQFKKNAEVVLNAIGYNIDNFVHAHESLRKDVKFLCRAIEIDRRIMEQLSYDFHLAFAMVKNNYRIWDHNQARISNGTCDA